MIRRPILIITLGFILGIITGLYFNIAPFLFLSLIFLTIILKPVNIQSNRRFIRILKIFIKNNLILIFLISSLISSIYIIYCNRRFENVYSNFKVNQILATVVTNNTETEYKDTYEIQLEEYEDIKLILRVSKSKEIGLKYGDRIRVKGEYIIPEEARNYGGFNYKEYLKIRNVYGIFEAERIEILENNNLSFIELFSNKVKLKIIENFNKILPESTSQLFLGILIGYDDNLQENIEESFEKSSLTHLLAVSGAHIAYIIVGFEFLFSKLKFSKKITNTITMVFLVFFMYITDFSSSVVRASIMGIIQLFSLMLYRKNDIKTCISISMLLILIDNPYKILDVGLILSYLATIGIICFSKLRKKTNRKLSLKEKVVEYIKELILITICANIFVTPIMVYNFNTISLTFVISNLFAGILIGPITIGGFILIIISFINLKSAHIISVPYNLLLELLVKCTNLTSKFKMSQILVPTPSAFSIAIYYIVLFLSISYIFIKRKYSNRYLVRKISYYIQSFLKVLKENLRLILISLFVFLILIILISYLIPKNLKIHFIDVGQGDSTLIITPTNKKIMIDSGGSETGSFDVGESTLLSYLLDRKITTLDYICISHFDSDHCHGFIYLLKNIKVKNIILSKQHETTYNFEEIMRIAKEKDINILKVEAGDTLQIDKFVKLKIFSPDEKLTDDINDNSIVMKLEHLDFSCLFTGDISQQIEQNLVKKYGRSLESDILKVAHHGSKTSSDESFIRTVRPKVALIGVGKNNKFGHPNSEVLRKLENIGSRTYRTDEDGEITIIINRKEGVKINRFIE